MFTKTCETILDAVAGDKVKNIDYQDARDMVTLNIVSDLQHYDKQLAEVDKNRCIRCLNVRLQPSQG